MSGGRSENGPSVNRALSNVGYRPFLSGGVTGTDTLAADDLRRSVPRLQGDHLQRSLAQIAQIERLAAQQGCVPAQLAPAWLLAQGSDIVQIPGTKRRVFLESGAAVADVTLTYDEAAALAAVFAPEAMMRWLNRPVTPDPPRR